MWDEKLRLSKISFRQTICEDTRPTDGKLVIYSRYERKIAIYNVLNIVINEKNSSVEKTKDVLLNYI